MEEVKSRSGNEGYDVATGEYVDLVKAGVIDPTKVIPLRAPECGFDLGSHAHHRSIGG